MIVIDIIFGFASVMLAFLLQQSIKENRRLKKDQELQRTQHEKAMEDGVVCILRKHLMDEHDYWMGQEYITPTALESNVSMYKAYKGLGGNGMIDHMEEEIMELPIR